MQFSAILPHAGHVGGPVTDALLPVQFTCGPCDTTHSTHEAIRYRCPLCPSHVPPVTPLRLPSTLAMPSVYIWPNCDTPSPLPPILSPPLTMQYKGLQSLYEKHKDAGLVILGFPCDQCEYDQATSVTIITVWPVVPCLWSWPSWGRPV